MRLDRLLEGLEVREVAGRDPGTVEVSSIAYDSRAVVPGALYFCVPGGHVDGHDYAGEAVRSGAVALLCERRVDAAAPQVVVPSTRAAMAPVSATFWGHPSQRLTVVGVTGTNGKTTTTHLLASIFGENGWPAAVVGTLTGMLTTPEAPDLQAKLASLASDGTQAVAMEVSSHALVQHRADAIRFAAAVFTNLSQDHLDFHGTMESYFEAKARLFERGRSGRAVVNRDDPWGRRLLASLTGASTYGLDDARSLLVGQKGSTFVWRGHPVRLALGGRFNVANALAAATAAEILGVAPAVIAAGLSTAEPVPGRYEAVDAGQDFTVLVDYAHTPDGLEQVLAAARTGLAEGRRVLVVFGCGGDRDRAKRPLMGDVATRLSDGAFLTSDNPRQEDPFSIIDEVRAGVPSERAEKLTVEEDRATAIRLAVGTAGRGDVVVIAGKGHETGQEVAGRILPFDDREVARRAITERLASGGTRR